MAGSSRSLTGVRAHIAASITTAAGGLALTAASVDAGTSVVAASLVGIGLSGLATLDRRLVVGQTAGVTASTIAVVMSVAASPVFTSIALIVLGAQLIAVGITTSQWWLRPAGAALTVGATVSLWWTTGTNQWVIDAIAPYGADGSDVAIAAVESPRCSIGGWLLRRTFAVSTWLAYSPGLGMAGTWLIATQLEAGNRLGDVRSAGHGNDRPGGRWRSQARCPTRARHADGGRHDRWSRPVNASRRHRRGRGSPSAASALLVIAALIERSERPLLPVGRRGDEQQSLLEQFCEEFE